MTREDLRSILGLFAFYAALSVGFALLWVASWH